MNEEQERNSFANEELVLFDGESERSVLGFMAMDKDAADIGISLLSPEDFFVLSYRLAFEAMQRVNKKERVIDIITLNEELIKGGLSKPDSVSILADVASCCGLRSNVRYYINILHEKTYLRKAVACAENIKKMALLGDIDLLGEAIEKAGEIAAQGDEVPSAKDVLERTAEAIDRNVQEQNSFTGLKTGFMCLDFLTGGLQKGDFYVIAARPSVGKTAFLLDILRNCAKGLCERNEIGVLFSLEMNSRQVGARIISAVSGIKGEKLKFSALSQQEREDMAKRVAETDKYFENIFICDNMDIAVKDMRGICHTLRAERRRKIGIIAVDYLQLIKSDASNRAYEIAKISMGLKRLAKTFDCPVVAVSQLNRGVEARDDKRPVLSDLRDSGSIEQDADAVLLLYRRDYYSREAQDGITEVNLAKQRSGNTGVFKLKFNSALATFENL